MHCPRHFNENKQKKLYLFDRHRHFSFKKKKDQQCYDQGECKADCFERFPNDFQKISE